MQALPAVNAASLATALPTRSISQQSYESAGVPVDPKKLKVTDFSRVTAEHVQGLGLQLLAGRHLSSSDVVTPEPSVALVNEAFAHANWPNQSALGKMFIFSGESGMNVNYTVVGVVSTAHQFGPDAASHPEIYLPGHRMAKMSLVVRTAGDRYRWQMQ